MTAHSFPKLDPDTIAPTRDALHAYALVLGSYLEALRPWRKHWWHISLRPSLSGMTTGVIRASSRSESASPGPLDFELELDAGRSLVHARTSTGVVKGEPLRGQPAGELAQSLNQFLSAIGLDPSRLPAHVPDEKKPIAGYSADVAAQLAAAWRAIGAAMEQFQSGIRNESSPIQLWPHHFDLAMMWLPGETIPGQDPDDEESSDKQMNFGFTFGDAGIPEPYFYITAYPLPEAFPNLELPAGAIWHTSDFHGAVLTYRSLLQNSDPTAYLLDLWTRLLSAGREHLVTKNS